MKEEINQVWTNRSRDYSKFVQAGLSKKYEREGWQKIFTEEIGVEKKKVLDVGTGPGVVAIQLAELGHDVSAVDLSEGMLEEAKENATRFGVTINFQKGDAENLPFPDSYFDVVVAKYVLWTLPDPLKALSEWHRVVKPGGKVVYVDGNWYQDLQRSWWRRRWRSFAKFVTMVTEFRNPNKAKDFDDKTRDKLWSTHANRPDDDLNMMRGVGFEKVQMRDGLKRRVMSGMRLIKIGFYKDYFLISGVKSNNS